MLIQATITNYGGAVGPFNIYYNTLSPDTFVLVASDVSLAELISGYSIDVDNNTKQI